MNSNCEKKNPSHCQNILHVDALYNIKERNTKRSRFFFSNFSLFAMQLDYCNIQRVFDQK